LAPKDYELAETPATYTVRTMLGLWPYYTSSLSQIEGGPLRKAWGRAFWTVRRGYRAFRLRLAWRMLTKLLIQEAPDIVLFGKIVFPLAGFYVERLRRRGIPSVQICHEFEIRESGALAKRIARTYYGHIFSKMALLFVLGEANRKKLLSLYAIPEGRTRSILHGNEAFFLDAARGRTSVDLRTRFGIGAAEPVALFFGTLAPSKGVPDLLEAFVGVRRAIKARLVIAGYPSKHIDFGALEGLANTLGLRDAVVFDARYIPMDEVGDLMGLASVVVFPYRDATQSGAVQVAYAFGRPVIATRVGGLPEVVEDDRSGILVAPGDPRGLEAAMLRLLTDPQRSAEMGAYARHLSETRFSWRPIATHVANECRRLGRKAEPRS
jgi:glycosyltransferase involved in cell wall biosynthesis